MDRRIDIYTNTAPQKRHESLRTLFKALVLNHFLRNGDAHLKNFAILYDEDYTDSRMARSMMSSVRQPISARVCRLLI